MTGKSSPTKLPLNATTTTSQSGAMGGGSLLSKFSSKCS